MNSPAAVPRMPIEDDVKEDLPPLSITRNEDEKNAEPRIADEVIAAHPEANAAFPVYERINERFYKGRYAGIEIMIDSTDGFICATKMFGAKKLEAWIINGRTKDLVKSIEEDLNATPRILGVANERISAVKILHAGYNVQFRGTWIHEDLILDFTLSQSYTYYKRVKAIVKAVEIRHQTEELRKRDLKIAELEAGVKQISLEKEGAGYETSIAEDATQEKQTLLFESEEEIVKRNDKLAASAIKEPLIAVLPAKDVKCLIISRLDDTDHYKFFVLAEGSMGSYLKFMRENRDHDEVYRINRLQNAAEVWRIFTTRNPTVIYRVRHKNVTVNDNVTEEMLTAAVESARRTVFELLTKVAPAASIL